MARTTLDLDASVVRELRRRGRHERKNMGQVASELLAQALAHDGAGAPIPPLPWVARDLGPPRVDLMDKVALDALLDERA
jgi:hypothetical protein